MDKLKTLSQDNRLSAIGTADSSAPTTISFSQGPTPQIETKDNKTKMIHDDAEIKMSPEQSLSESSEPQAVNQAHNQTTLTPTKSRESNHSTESQEYVTPSQGPMLQQSSSKMDYSLNATPSQSKTYVSPTHCVNVTTSQKAAKVTTSQEAGNVTKSQEGVNVTTSNEAVDVTPSNEEVDVTPSQEAVNVAPVKACRPTIFQSKSTQ